MATSAELGHGETDEEAVVWPTGERGKGAERDHAMLAAMELGGRPWPPA
jgi:hypothetical protein